MFNMQWFCIFTSTLSSQRKQVIKPPIERNPNYFGGVGYKAWWSCRKSEGVEEGDVGNGKSG
jgi:hypothetical protein